MLLVNNLHSEQYYMGSINLHRKNLFRLNFNVKILFINHAVLV